MSKKSSPKRLSAWQRIIHWFSHPPDWTGLGSYTDPDGKHVRGKTVWDWATLLLVPLCLLIVTLSFNFIQDNNRQQMEVAARQLNEEQIREAALQDYLNDIDKLMLDDGLGSPLTGD